MALTKVPNALLLTPGGGGGGTLSWVEGVPSPSLVVENNIEVYRFMSGETQALWTAVKLPAAFVAGFQINMKSFWYSDDTSNTSLISATSTLIRYGTDLLTSTTNQRTSTNAAVTNTGSTNGKPQLVTFDLTDTAGAVNSVAASPNDILIVKIFRGSDSGTDDLRFMHLAAEVTTV